MGDDGFRLEFGDGHAVDYVVHCTFGAVGDSYCHVSSSEIMGGAG